MRIGRQQLRLLMLLGSPGNVLVTPADRVAKALIRRGLLAEGEGVAITPAGLRALADELEAGRVAQHLIARRAA